jgi:multidrug transporter EmrE-like cation transporter
MGQNRWVWLAVALAVVLSIAADACAKLYWSSGRPWYYGLCVALLGMSTFFCFGYVAHKFGLSVASALTNSLVVIGPIFVGLILFNEWKLLNAPVAAAMVGIVICIVVIIVFRKEPDDLKNEEPATAMQQHEP